MQDLLFVYHNTEAWSRKHPALFWPMPPCRMRSNTSWDKVGGLGWPDCPEEDCRAWYAEPQDRAAVHGASVRFTYYGMRDGMTLGIGWSYVSESYREALSPAGTWREVARNSYRNEGIGGYGYWFSYATGSGMWLNVGRTALVPVKNDFVAVGNMFFPEWCKLRNRTCKNHTRDALADVVRVRGIHVEEPNLILPFAAYDLGYDTVQFQQGVSKMPELVVTSDVAMVRPGCEIRTPRTAPKYKALMAVYCPPGPDGCGASIEFRTGARAERPCVCDRSELALNCNLTT